MPIFPQLSLSLSSSLVDVPPIMLMCYDPATAIAFAEQGCNLLLADIECQQAKLEEVVSACYNAATSAGINNKSNTYTSILPHVCNVTNRLHVQKTILAADEIARSATAMTSSNSVASILVNCAGITRDGRLANVTNEDWDVVLDVNLKGTFLMCQEFCEPTRLRKLFGGEDNTGENGGSIINIGSVVSNYGNVGQVNYAASKGGVVGLTRSIAKEMALLSWKATSALDIVGNDNDTDGVIGSAAVPPTIRVNCIQPGTIVTLSTLLPFYRAEVLSIPIMCADCLKFAQDSLLRPWHMPYPKGFFQR